MFSWNRLHTGIKAIFFVQIVNRMGDFVVPFLTLILTQVQGFSPGHAGVVVTLATALGSLGGLVAGKLADGRSRRDVLVVFLATSGALLAAAGFAPAHLAATVAMVASGFFLGAMRPILGALVADLADADTRRAAFSLSYLGINLGVAVGPLAAGWLFTHALAWMFWLDALSTACAVLLLLRFVPRNTGVPHHDQPTGGSISAFVRNRVLFPFSLLLIVYNFVYAQTIFSLALELVELFGAQGATTFGLVWAINAVTVVALTPLAMRLTKTWTNLKSMAWATAFIAVGFSVYLFDPDLVLVVISTLAWTTGEVYFSIHMGDLVATHSPPALRARFQAYVAFLGSVGFVVAPALAGLVTENWGLDGVWWMAVVLVVAVGTGFGLLNRVRVPLIAE